MVAWLNLLALAGLASAQGGGSAMLRFGCSNIVIDRVDP